MGGSGGLYTIAKARDSRVIFFLIKGEMNELTLVWPFLVAQGLHFPDLTCAAHSFSPYLSLSKNTHLLSKPCSSPPQGRLSASEAFW